MLGYIEKDMKHRTEFFIVGSILIILAIISGVLAWMAGKNTHVVVEWTTASEIGTAGFYLYKGLEVDDINEQVNANLIPAASNALEGSEYEYQDYDVEPGNTYFYELEEVDNQGARVRYGPIQVQAKRGGMVELALALILAMSGLFFLVWGWSRSPGNVPVLPS